MGVSLSPNILSWGPTDVARWLDMIGLSGLKATALQKSVTGPQLLGMTSEELCEQLGATVLQSRKILSEINKVNEGDVSDPSADYQASRAAEEAAAAAAAEAAAYNTAATVASVPDVNDVSGYASYEQQQPSPTYRPQVDPVAASAVAAGITAAGAAGAAYYANAANHSPSPTTIFYADPVPVQPQQYPPQQQIPVNGSGAASNIAPIKTNAYREDSHKSLCRAFFIPWMLFLLPLLMAAGTDLGLSLYINQECDNVDDLIVAEKYNTCPSGSPFGVKSLSGDQLWCSLFFAAQGYTILVTVILLILQCSIGRNGSLRAAKNLAFASFLLSIIGLALYALPISKWTQVIVTDYDFTSVFDGQAIEAATFGVEWFAVLLWLVVLIMSIIQLSMLSKKKYNQ